MMNKHGITMLTIAPVKLPYDSFSFASVGSEGSYLWYNNVNRKQHETTWHGGIRTTFTPHTQRNAPAWQFIAVLR